jgi:hypothetical protein
MQICGWDGLADFLGVCKSKAETIAKVRGLGVGKKFSGSTYRRVWEVSSVEKWKAEVNWESIPPKNNWKRKGPRSRRI